MHPILAQIKKNSVANQSHICVGLDPDLDLIPRHLPQTLSGIETFLYTIIEHTSAYCVAYKANISFFESLGIEGLQLLGKLRSRISPTIPLIIDGKRGDIGNTSKHQARFLFDHLGADASTVNPYMGHDAVQPFFEYRDKLHFVLVLTSNPGASDIERLVLESKRPLYESVFQKCIGWQEQYSNIGCVVGATQSELGQIRKLDAKLPFLIPGVGRQGGTYKFSVENGLNQDDIVLVNIGRSILYASSDTDFGTAAEAAARTYLS